MTEVPPQPPAGGGDPWPPRRVPSTPAPARRGATLRAAPSRDLAGLAALVAAGLGTAGALVVLVLATSPFGLTLADRLREATAGVLLAVPLWLAAALVLVGHGVGRDRPAGAGAGAVGEVVAVGAAVVGCTFGVLAAGRLGADLLAAGPATGAGGGAARVRDVLVDLGAVVLTAALVAWAARRDAT
jgi:hypothetical protein